MSSPSVYSTKTCKDCSRTLPLREFKPNRWMRDGHLNSCRECVNAAWREQRRKRLERRAALPQPDKVPILCGKTKTCSKCIQTKPVEEFRLENAHADGYSSACKECLNTYQSAYRNLTEEEWVNYTIEHRLSNLQKRHAANPPPQEKKCNKCGILKPLTDFRIHNNQRRRDNRTGVCKSCLNEDQNSKSGRRRRYRLKNGDNIMMIKIRRMWNEHATDGYHSPEEWATLCARYDYTCLCCGKKKRLTRDHILPVGSPGSTDNISNIQPLCTSCNSSKGTKTTDYRYNWIPDTHPLIKATQKA